MPRARLPPRQERRAAVGTEFHGFYKLGIACLQRNQFTEVAEHLSEALRFKADDVSALSNLGFALSASGRFAEALSAYDRRE
jgi:Flp pilus assembly protein TadD